METMINTIGYSDALHSHTGWSEAEDKLLFDTVMNARTSGKPLKAAFDQIALITSRKPNSVRNYYYSRIRDEEIKAKYSSSVIETTAFVPFEEAEVVAMLERILSDQAKGISVRASTMALGDGDTTLMLRYQNKYRSVVKNNRELVKKVIESLEERGIKARDPYAVRSGKTAGRPRKVQEHQLIDIMSDTVSELACVEGLDVTALFESLGALAVSAGKGAIAIKRLEQLENSELGVSESENSELRELLLTQDKELSEAKTKIHTLTGALRKLVAVNSGFLELTGMAKVSSLSNYVRDLSQTVNDISALAY